MPDDQVLRLLQEIRDLQKQHLQHYQDALANQREAIATQKQAVQRSRRLLLVIGVIVVAIYLFPIFLWSTTSGLRCIFRH